MKNETSSEFCRLRYVRIQWRDQETGTGTELGVTDLRKLKFALQCPNANPASSRANGFRASFKRPNARGAHRSALTTVSAGHARLCLLASARCRPPDIVHHAPSHRMPLATARSSQHFTGIIVVVVVALHLPPHWAGPVPMPRGPAAPAFTAVAHRQRAPGSWLCGGS